MENSVKEIYSWWTEDYASGCLVESAEEAIQDVLGELKSGEYPFDDEDSPTTVTIGTVEFFDVQGAVKEYLEGLEEFLQERAEEFFSGVDMDIEVSLRRDRERFVQVATNTVMPYLDASLFVNPTWLCQGGREYDLVKKEFVARGTEH